MFFREKQKWYIQHFQCCWCIFVSIQTKLNFNLENMLEFALNLIFPPKRWPELTLTDGLLLYRHIFPNKMHPLWFASSLHMTAPDLSDLSVLQKSGLPTAEPLCLVCKNHNVDLFFTLWHVLLTQVISVQGRSVRFNTRAAVEIGLEANCQFFQRNWQSYWFYLLPGCSYRTQMSLP